MSFFCTASKAALGELTTCVRYPSPFRSNRNASCTSDWSSTIKTVLVEPGTSSFVPVTAEPGKQGPLLREPPDRPFSFPGKRQVERYEGRKTISPSTLQNPLHQGSAACPPMPGH